MSDELTLDLKLHRKIIPTIQQPQLVYALLNIRPSADLGTVQLPVSLTLVVDRSESMCIPILSEELFEELARRGGVREVVVDGVPVWEFQNVPDDMARLAPRSLDFVKDGLQSAVERLAPQDRFSLVVFATEAQVLAANQPAENRRRLLSAIDQLDQLHLGDETRMARGMALGHEEAAKSISSKIVSRMVLLTDGFTADNAECLSLAQRATAAGLAISTVGIGGEFNEELLISISDLSKGNAYFINDSQDIPAVFSQELNGVQAISLRNLELKLRLTRGVELRRAYRLKPAITEMGRGTLSDNAIGFPLGDLAQNEEQSVLLEILAPPRPAGNYRLAQLVLAYDSPIQNQLGQKLRQDIIVRYAQGEEAPQLDSHVMAVVERVSAHTLQTRALQDAQSGDMVGATAKLEAARTRLLAMGEVDLAEITMQEIENLQTQGQVSAAGTKRLRYETRRLVD